MRYYLQLHRYPDHGLLNRDPPFLYDDCAVETRKSDELTQAIDQQVFLTGYPERNRSDHAVFFSITGY
jgi:hypothetical protein